MARTLHDTLEMKNGVKIPLLGYGTWNLPNDEEGAEAVRQALEFGYRHIDTAAAYRNEEAVGEGIRRSGLKREEIFLTTKFPNYVRGYEESKKELDDSLKRLKTDYLDLYLVHWPNPRRYRSNWQEANAESWRALEEAAEAGKIRALGVSNFMRHHLEALAETAKIKPQVNQIKLCPGVHDDSQVHYSREQGMLLEAYSPLGQGEILTHPLMLELAGKYGKTAAQIALRWGLQNDFIVIPKTAHAGRMKENMDLYDFELEEDEMAAISALDFPEFYPDHPDKVNF